MLGIKLNHVSKRGPRYAHGIVVLCIVVVMQSVIMDYHCGFFVIDLPIFFRIASLSLELLYDCPSASEVTLKYMGKWNSANPQKITLRGPLGIHCTCRSVNCNHHTSHSILSDLSHPMAASSTPGPGVHPSFPRTIEIWH